MGISRRGAIKAAVATAIGLGTGTIAYGIAYERHHIRRIDLDLHVTGLPAALDGLRIGLITDVHHSEVGAGRRRVARGGTAGRGQARPDRARRRLRDVWRPEVRRPGGRTAVASGRRASRFVRGARQSRRRSRHAGRAHATGLHGSQGPAHESGDPGRDARSRGDPLLDATPVRPRARAQRHRVAPRSCSPTIRGAWSKPRRSTCSWCSRATRTAGRWCCPASARSPGESSRCSPASAPRRTPPCS